MAPWSRELLQNAAEHAIIDVGQALQLAGVLEKSEAGNQLPSSRVSTFQAAKTRAGVPGGQRPGCSEGRREGRYPAQNRRSGFGPASEVQGLDRRGHRQPYRRPMVCQPLHRHRLTPASAQGRTHHRGRRRHHKTGRLLKENRGGESQGTGTSPETTEEAV